MNSALVHRLWQSTLLPLVAAHIIIAADYWPRFKVATIKPVDPHSVHITGVDVYPGGRVVIKSLTLKDLICAAFQVSYWQLSGGQRWTGAERYNIVALPPENMRASITDTRHTLYGIDDKRLREMLQALLIRRFQLKFHWEKKTGRVYLLETSGKALRLRASDSVPKGANRPANTFGSIGFAGNWVIYNTTMPQLAKFAGDYYIHRPVLDRTGFSGAFDYKSPAEDEAIYSNDQNGSFLNLLREIGLKLKPAQGIVETFVIDRANKPTPN